MKQFLWNLGYISVCCWFIAYATLEFDLVVMNDDEFIVYQGFSCIFRERELGDWCLPPLMLPGLVGALTGPLHLLSYEYVGWPQAIPYWALAFFFPSPVTTRFFGLFAMGLCSWMAAARYRLSVPAVFTCLLAFAPWSFNHLYDLGQHALPFPILIYVLLQLVSRVGQPHLRYGQYLLLGLLLVLGLWARLSFLFVLPATGYLFLIHLLRNRRRRTIFQLASACGILVLGFSLPAFLLLSAEQNGRPYYRVVSNNTGLAYVTNPAAQYAHFKREFLPLFLNPPYAARVAKPFSPTEVSYTALLYLSLAAIVLGGLVKCSARNRRRSLHFFACTILTALVVNASERSWSMHHLMYSFPFALLGILELWKGLTPRGLVRMALVANVCAFSVVWFQILSKPDANPWLGGPVPDLLAEIRSQAHLEPSVVVIDWGACFASNATLPWDIPVSCLHSSEFEKNGRYYLERIKASDRKFIILIVQPKPETLELLREVLGDVDIIQKDLWTRVKV